MAKTKTTDSKVDAVKRPDGVSRQHHRQIIQRVEKIADQMAADEKLAQSIAYLDHKGYSLEDIDIALTILHHVKSNGK